MEENERMQEVEEINTRVQMLDKVFHFNKEYLQKSHQIHLVCTALLSLHETLQGGENLISDATASLKVISGVLRESNTECVRFSISYA